MVALAEWIQSEKPAAEPKTRVWDFFASDPGRVGKLASQVVEPHRENRPSPLRPASGRALGPKYAPGAGLRAHFRSGAHMNSDAHYRNLAIVGIASAPSGIYLAAEGGAAFVGWVATTSEVSASGVWIGGTTKTIYTGATVEGLSAMTGALVREGITHTLPRLAPYGPGAAKLVEWADDIFSDKTGAPSTTGGAAWAAGREGMGLANE